MRLFTLKKSLKHLTVGSDCSLQEGSVFQFPILFYFETTVEECRNIDTCHMENTFVASSGMKLCTVEMEEC